jgi:hypothetical protein
MVLKNLLVEKREIILDCWLKSVLETYPEQSAVFLTQNRDRFQNPIRYNIAEGIKLLYDQLTADIIPEKNAVPLDDIIRIRSIQTFLPSQAVAFVFQLKNIIREQLAGEIEKDNLGRELHELETKIDRLALRAFDNYMECREKLHEIRIREIRQSIFKPFDRPIRKIADSGQNGDF